MKFVMRGKKYGKVLNLTRIQLYAMVVVMKVKMLCYLAHRVKHENVCWKKALHIVGIVNDIHVISYQQNQRKKKLFKR